MSSNTQDEVQDLLSKLQAPIENVDTLLAYLSAPLDSIGLLPPVYRRFNVHPLPSGIRVLCQDLSTYLAVPTRHPAAHRTDMGCDSAREEGPASAGPIFLGRGGSRGVFDLVSTSPLSPYALRVLGELSIQYPVDRLYTAIVVSRDDLDGPEKERVWGDCVSNLVNVPAKVANSVGLEGMIPRVLENATFFNRLAVRVESLVSSLATGKDKQESVPYLAYLLGRLVAQGAFPPSPPTTRTQPSFFQATLPTIQSKVYSPTRQAYFAYWNELLANLPSILSLQSILISLFGSLRTLEPPLDDSPSQRALVREEAITLTDFVGAPQPDTEELWETVSSIILKRSWPLSHARVFVCWISGASRGGDINLAALEALLKNVLERWADPEHVKHSLLSQHHFVTSLLLLSASYFSEDSPPMRDLSFNTGFIQGVGRYLGHQDKSVRLCGMLVGEEIARMSGKKLEFGGWDGEESGKPWARALRKLLRGRDVDADVEKADMGAPPPDESDAALEELVSPAAMRAAMEEVEDEPEPHKVQFKDTAAGYDSDDSLAGYESPPSSRSASPTASELAEIEKDPSLNVNVKKIPRPVYLKQLGDLLKGGKKTSTEDAHEADRIEMALNTAEELIRKKKDYGTELAENAVNLEYSLLSLNDNYEIEGFSAKRQGAMIALVSCAPRQAAPALIEEFFKNQYSVEQRYVILNALALGARELASLPVPESRVPAHRIAFPSKTLPPSLHNKYLTAGNESSELVPLLMENISRNALDQQKPPENPVLAREKVLRIKKASGISEISKPNKLGAQAPPKRTTFTEVAAEYFIAPLTNRFWLFLREEQMREERTAHLEGRSRYHGTGTGLILNPLVLSHFLKTLGILVNASQNAPEWLAIIAPDALELAVTIGTRPISHTEGLDEDGGAGGKEASVLGGALELALCVLDGAISVDGGRSLSLDHTHLLLGTSEWAAKIFSNLEKGLKVEGEGGVHEVRLRSVTAGVLLKVDEITTKWRRSMLDYM
ncbi:telomeric DNA binding protein [Ephemerocybe angulata]|uniref:Telomeric DNA binding protein n=1 Tax=Ephemerocybe angulata TaxID=980116 RepID=A0A8H6MFZ3_9AGAR|nr:telomeric DNA binding protein [Tulosesus angulatus]